VPVFIDEYKPFDMQRYKRNVLHRYMRRLYTGEVEGRGRADQTVTSYRLSAPLCLAGETRPIESALVERIVTANPSKDQLQREPAHEAAFRKVKTVDPSLLTEGIIRHLLTRDTAEDLAVARRVVDRLLAGAEVPLRFKDNLAVVVAGLLHFEGYADSLGVKLPELDIEAFVKAEVEDLLDSGGCAVKTGLDYFMETLSSLAVSGVIQHGRQYYYAGGSLALHIPSCHAAYAEHCRRAGFEGEVIDKKALNRQLQEALRRGGYVVALNRPTSFGSRGEKRRATHIDIEAAKAVLDVDDFPQPDPEIDGGYRGGWEPD
jgi:hypothetical protein